jgi:hypothetical protein
VAPPPDPVAAVGEVVAAISESIGKAVKAVTNLGKDLSVEEKKQAQPVAVAIIVSQVAQAAAAAVAASNTGRNKK